jgi:integrase
MLMLEYRDESGRRRNSSLRHTDFDRGKEAADALALALRRQEGPRSDELSLHALFDMYLREVTQDKSVAQQGHDRAASRLFERCWGVGARVADLDKTDWDQFIRQRRGGQLRPAGRKTKTGVRNRMIQRDLKFLMAVCNWAVTVRAGNRRLLDRNPFAGFTVPSEQSPRRPRITDEEYEALRTAAKELATEVGLFLYLVHESGHRSKSVSLLRWGDLDLAKRSIIWRAEHDKLRRQHETPLTAEHVEQLLSVRRASGRIGDGWLFPSPLDADDPISRREIVRWWAQLEGRAGLPRVKGRGWHSLRRKFAEENDDLPAAQLMALGGWRSYKTIVETYQAPSVDKLRGALESRSKAREAARVARTTTTNDNQAPSSDGEGVHEVAATA